MIFVDQWLTKLSTTLTCVSHRELVHAEDLAGLNPFDAEHACRFKTWSVNHPLYCKSEHLDPYLWVPLRKSTSTQIQLCHTNFRVQIYLTLRVLDISLNNHHIHSDSGAQFRLTPAKFQSFTCALTDANIIHIMHNCLWSITMVHTKAHMTCLTMTYFDQRQCVNMLLPDLIRSNSCSARTTRLTPA